ncbi:MAG: prolyl oligopeptidase family serine peptidase [Gammaproteobacteria bacterium]|nr:prolyl oligopeptidase family serine peptidase [Gammaproteobacteria bacterium]
MDFANEIPGHNCAGPDYDDLMAGVDAVIDQGYIDEDQLFVTGGSASVLTAWIVGNTDDSRLPRWQSLSLTGPARCSTAILP